MHIPEDSVQANLLIYLRIVNWLLPENIPGQGQNSSRATKPRSALPETREPLWLEQRPLLWPRDKSQHPPSPSLLFFSFPRTLSASPQKPFYRKKEETFARARIIFIVTPHCFFVLPQTATLFVEFFFSLLFFLTHYHCDSISEIRGCSFSLVLDSIRFPASGVTTTTTITNNHTNLTTSSSS